MTSEFQLDMEGFPLLLSNGDEEMVQSCIHTEDSRCVKKKTSQIGMDDFFKNFLLLESFSNSGSENSVCDSVDDFTTNHAAYPFLTNSDSELADDDNYAGVNNSTDTDTSSDKEATEDSAVFYGKTKKRSNPGETLTTFLPITRLSNFMFNFLSSMNKSSVFVWMVLAIQSIRSS